MFGLRALAAACTLLVGASASGCIAGSGDDSSAPSEDAPGDGDGGTAHFDSGIVTDAPPSDALKDSVGDVGDATLDSTPPPALGDPCFRFPGKEAWNCGSDGNTMTRTKGGATESTKCANGCVSLPFGFDDQCRPRGGALSSTVNGHAMSAQQSGWVHYVAWCAVPRMQGTRDVRLTDAARVTWWSLKEGVLGAASPNPVGFSLCTTSSGDVRIGPLATCGAGAPWQVGVSAVQVTCCSLAELETMATKLYPGLTSDQVLAGTATEADYLPGTSTADGIVASKDSLRASWLLHDTPIGFTYQAPIVTSECVTGSKSWCYGTGWTESADYAPDKASAMTSISDVRAILDELAP